MSLATGDASFEPFKIDVRSGRFGYNASHEVLLKAKLSTALNDGGALIIRVFDHTRNVSVITPKGILGVPLKRIYAYHLANDHAIPLTSAKIRHNSCFDVRSGISPA